MCYREVGSEIKSQNSRFNYQRRVSESTINYQRLRRGRVIEITEVKGFGVCELIFNKPEIFPRATLPL